MQDEKRPQDGDGVDRAAEARHHRRKHVALWTAVGGTMALIAVMWVMLLPFQLKGGSFSGLKDATRWYTVNLDNDPSKKTFDEAIGSLGAKLDQIEKDQRDRVRAQQQITAEQTSPAVRGEVDALRTRIEAASKKNELTPSDAAVDAETRIQP